MIRLATLLVLLISAAACAQLTKFTLHNQAETEVVKCNVQEPRRVTYKIIQIGSQKWSIALNHSVIPATTPP